MSPRAARFYRRQRGLAQASIRRAVCRKRYVGRWIAGRHVAAAFERSRLYGLRLLYPHERWGWV